MALFDDLTPSPPDALLGLMTAYRADTREEKFDLGVGVFRNDAGQTPVMKAVREAERRLAEAQDTKVYEGPSGNDVFAGAIADMVTDRKDPAPVAFSAPGGTGALSLAMRLIERLNPDATMWLADPTWANHGKIAGAAGLRTQPYPYATFGDPGVDLDRVMAGLEEAKRGDAVLIQGPCHNPTGIDLSDDQWPILAEFCAEAGLLPLIDVAYHGFARGLDEDIAGIRTFVAKVPEALVTYSCSKNFGLYRERCGALIAVLQSERATEAVRSNLADIGRAIFSMPPAHGQAIVAEILGSEDLSAMWREELEDMRNRINGLRADLADALAPKSNSYDPKVLTRQYGMFSQLPFEKGGTEALREKGVYIPGSGRINVAGLTRADIGRAAALLSAHL